MAECCHHQSSGEASSASSARAPGPGYYTCPMHPEVMQKGPGICPKCGMALDPMDAGAMPDDSELRDMTRRLVVAAVLSVPVVILGMAHWLHGTNFAHWSEGAVSQGIQAVLSAVVLFGCGWPFLQRAWQSLRNRSANMFTLIATGTLAAWGFSMFVLFFPGRAGAEGVYFEAAAVIVTLVLVGQVLELRARLRTGDALRALLDLAPVMAWKLDDRGLAEEVPLESVQPGDLLRVKPGGKVPVDGVVVAGHGTLDESMLTGESWPIEAAPGAKVRAGTLNTTGTMDLRAEAVGAGTLLSQIVELVAQAQRARAPVQELADRVSAVFVPTVVACAVLAFAAWMFFLGSIAMALTAAVSVLIIACPCAIGLAVPMSIATGIGRAARLGVLVRQPAALERLEKIDTVCLDKTGTLTEGRPEVVKTVLVPGGDEKFFWSAAAALESRSGHPLAGAIVRASEPHVAGDAGLEEFHSEAGGGVMGKLAGVEVRAGTPEFAGSASAPVSWQEGYSRVDVSADGRWLGTFLLEDVVRPSARPSLEELRRSGIRVVMLTGDREGVARKVAGELGIAEFRAGMKPAEKAEAVRGLQADGRRVCMAGDGVNDAPALAAADVGLAMGAGSDVAKETADLVLVQGSLQGVTRAFALGRAIMRNVRQNLFLAFAYNTLGIPLAAGVLYPLTGWLLSPMIAGAAMSLSSVSVIANALRLNRIRIGA